MKIDVEGIRGKATVTKVCKPSARESVPLLLKFQNGNLFSSVVGTKTKFCRYKQNEGKGALIATQGEFYHGLINNTEADELTDSYICIRNKTTNKMRIIPIEHASLKNHVYNEEIDNKVGDKNIDKITRKKQALKKFGGRNSLRAITTSEKTKINVEAFQDDLDAAIKNTTITEDENVPNFEENYELLRPNLNKEAKTLEDIYNITDIISSELLDRLDEEADAVLNADIEDLPIQSEYLKDLIKKSKDSKDTNETKLNVKLIIYMDCLLNLIRTHALHIKKVELSLISEKVENHIRLQFSDPKTPFLRTKFSEEKAICFYIVLALLISGNYQIDINHLMQDLQVKKQTLLQYSRIVCASTNKSSSNLHLRLPSKIQPLKLTFQKRHK